MAVTSPAPMYDSPMLDRIGSFPGLDLFSTTADKVLTWGSANSLWIFPMATSCCGIEFMAAATARVDIDRMGSIVRGSPRQSDVMVVAGTITVKMAPRVKKLWDQMPEPKWCIAMGSCAISGDFYRDIYSVIPGIDTVVPVDVYVPGCPPNPEQLMNGMMRLQDKIRAQQAGEWSEPETRPETDKMLTQPAIGRLLDDQRGDAVSDDQLDGARNLGMHGNESRSNDQGGVAVDPPPTKA
jgi:NADH-quinone oxidoreductase subunit B